MEPAPTRLERCLPWAAVVAAAWLALFPITSVDAYYHLATGKRILETGSIPTRGVGSASFGQAPWHDNEWGFQAVAAAIGTTERDDSGVVVLTPSGRAGLIVMRSAVCALTLACLVATMQALGLAGSLCALGVWLAAFLTFGNLFWDVRPQIFSYLALAACAWLLEKARRGDSWALPLVLVVIAAWANVHGAFVLGWALVGCEAAGAWFETRHDPGRRREAWRLTLAAIAAPAAACVNPFGWRQLVHPFTYLVNPGIYAGNNEWTRPDLVHLPLLVVSFGVLVAAAIAGARPRAGHVLRLVVFGGLFLTAIRHLPVLAIVAVPVGAAMVGEAGWFHRRPRGLPSRLAVTLLVAVAIVVLSGAKFISWRPSFDERPSRPLPEAHVRYLARRHLAGAGFNDYRFGGFLMLRLYPREVVVMDGRNDLYGRFRTHVYNPVLLSQPDWEPLWQDMMSRWDIRWVLIDADAPFAKALARDSAWHRVTDDGLAEGSIALFIYE